MVGHIRHTVMDEIAKIIMIGLSTPGVTMRNASFFERLPYKKKSKINAIGSMITNS